MELRSVRATSDAAIANPEPKRYGVRLNAQAPLVHMSGQHQTHWSALAERFDYAPACTTNGRADL